MTRSTSSRALGSKVAQRVLILFAVCVVVPVVVLGVATYRSVREGLLKQAQENVRLASKRVGMAVSAELDGWDTALAVADSTGGAHLDPRFEAAALVAGGRIRKLRGRLPSLPALDPARRRQLQDGGTVMNVVATDGRPLVLLGRLSVRARPRGAVLWAAVPVAALGRVLDPEDMSPAGVGPCVIASGGVPLYCPGTGWPVTPGALAPALGRAPSGSFVFSVGNARMLAGYWSLFLEYRFATSDWRVLYAEPLEAGLSPLTRFSQTFPLAGLLAVLIVAFLSFGQIRRSFGPLRILREATQRVARRDFGHLVEIRSGDEFEDLAGAFNGMAQSLQRQFAEAEALTEALRRTSEELVERGARLSAVLESAADGIVVLDPAGRVESFSGQAERLFGYRGRDAAGRSLAELFAMPAAGDARAGSQSEQLRTLVPQAVGRRADGTTFPAEVAVTQAHVGDRVLDTVFVRDISERKRAQQEREQLEAQLRQAQKMETVGTLAGGIAHDFNNLLAPILTTVDLLLTDAPRQGALRDDLEQVRRAALRAKDLVRQILTFSRRAEQQVAPLHLTPLIGEALALLRASLPATIEIRSDLEPGVGVVGDGSQLQQVVMNLCTNAFHAMRETGGVLDVRLETVVPDGALAAEHPGLAAAGRAARLTVRDTGHGMDAATLERLFEPFFTTKAPGEGTGLGMAIVHGIVSTHGGAITVDSAPGAGATFQVYLPARGAAPAAAVPAAAGARRGEGRVLVVDDEVVIGRLTARVLARRGYEVTTAATPAEALVAVAQSSLKFDLLITDQTMPGMTGLELAERVHAAHPALPIILMTGYAELGGGEASSGRGIVELLIKPIENEALAAAVARILHSSQRGAA
jgi:two-component system, cell cycle sensor histidine kinase and response regulator CckA